MHNQTWKALNPKPENRATKLFAALLGCALIVAPILVGIIQYTN